MRYPLNERRVKVGYGFGDPWFNTGKKHTGEDDHASVGEAVYAPANGVIYNHTHDPKWGNGVVIAFDGGDGCTLWHVDHMLPDGTHVAEGQQIATVYNLGNNTHLHVSFWQGSYDSHLTVGALPPAQFPDRFVEPDHYLDSHPDHAAPPPPPPPPPPPGHDPNAVHPAHPVSGHTFKPQTQWYDWGNLSPIKGATLAAHTGVNWTEAKKVNGVWFDRIAKPDGSPGSWCLKDADVDDGGFDPPHFA